MSREKYKLRGHVTLVDTDRDGWVVQSESDDYYLCTVRDDCGGEIAVGLAWSPRIENAHHFFSKELLEGYVKGIGERYRVLEHKQMEVIP